MNKKLLSICLVLSICAVALVPIYKQLDISKNETVHPVTESYAQNSAAVSSMQQQVSADDYTVTYPQVEEKAAPKEATPAKKNTEPSTTKPVASTSTKKTTISKTTSTKKTSTTSKTTSSPVVSKPVASKPLATTSVTPSRSTTSTKAPTSSKASAVITTAKSFIGIPYVWGGQSPSGFDCSGFIQYTLKKHEISIPRTSAEQYTAGTSVSKSNLRVGDLVFFTTYKAGPSHLGFYLGSGDFIHASSSKGVTISNLSSTYYSSRYIGARRVIN